MKKPYPFFAAVLASTVLSALAFAGPDPDDSDPQPPPTPAPPPTPSPEAKGDQPVAPTVTEPKDEKEKPKWKVDAAHGAEHDVAIDVREGTWMNVTVSGDRVVFDLLGDLWTMPLAGGEAKPLTSGRAWDTEPRFSPDGKRIAYVSDAGGNEQIWVMDADGKNARQVTHEDTARVTEPVWDPTGPWIVARRRTVDTRSIGVTELWQYHVDGGKGFALTSLDEHPHAGEQALSADGRYVYFSTRAGRFEYNHDPMGGLWSIVRLDRKTGEILPIVDGSGGAARPTLLPDGRHMTFISRDREKTLLEVIDLATGKRKTLLSDGMDRDEMEGFAIHDVYPEMAWVPAPAPPKGPAGGARSAGLGAADPTAGHLVLWAKGKLWQVGLDGSKTEIPFHASGTWKVHDIERWAHDVPDQIRSRVVRWPEWGPDGSVAFSALGELWLRGKDGKIEKLSPDGAAGYAPAWSPDGKQLAWTSWDDEDGGRLHVTTMGKKRTDEVLPVEGQLVNPAWSEDGSRIVALRGVGGVTSPDLGAEPWYEIVLLTKDKKGWTQKVVTSTSNRGSSERASRLYLHGDRVWFLEDVPPEGRKPNDTALVSVALDGTDKKTHLVFPGAEEIAISPDFTRVAYQLHHEAFVAPLPMWSKVAVGDEPIPSTRLTKIVGDWLGWTPDGKAVTWAEGPTLKKKPIEGLGITFGADGEPPKEPDYDTGVESVEVRLEVPRARPDGVIALTHARVLTMKGDEIVDDATVVIDRDRIESVEKGGAVPAGAKVIDATGKTVIPGFVDVHAHLHYTAGDVLPEQEWRYQTALDFGVTTVHDPSASTDLVFTQAERVEAGLEKGPRVYSTGMILYGALSNQGADTPDPDAAIDNVRRMEDVGAFSVKVYQQSQRERRQWYAQACYQEHVLCVPEGGGDLWQDLEFVVDGYQAMEHALPTSPIYDDVIQLLAGSHTATSPSFAYTPTLLVAYGGLMGENWFYQNMNPIDDQRLLRHFPKRELEAQTWRRDILAQDATWNFQSVARDAAKLYRKGVNVTLGAHGQLQGLGVHWELWALASDGAMTPMEALHAGTIDGATYLGLDKQIGTVEAGKLADLVVLNGDPLSNIHESRDIAFTVKNGEIFQ